MNITPRSEWGSQAHDLQPTTLDTTSVLYVHHSVTFVPASASTTHERTHMRQLEAEHLARGFLGIGYSYVVFPSGRVYEGRTFGWLPAATADHNSHSGAVCLVGNFETQPTTWAARRSLIELARRFPGKHLQGHRDAVATACPGKNLYAQLPRIRWWAKKVF